jgi:hypothetical protein
MTSPSGPNALSAGAGKPLPGDAGDDPKTATPATPPAMPPPPRRGSDRLSSSWRSDSSWSIWRSSFLSEPDDFVE